MQWSVPMTLSKNDVVFAVAVALGTLLMMTIALSAQDPEPPLDPRIEKYDKGPARIDVSKYPKETQAQYKVFAAKCGKCHTLARAVNCELVLEDEWERYIKRMMNKAGTFISAEEGRQIYEFVVHDSKTRKKALYDKRIKEIK
jgi:hypothetical protein